MFSVRVGCEIIYIYQVFPILHSVHSVPRSINNVYILFDTYHPYIFLLLFLPKNLMGSKWLMLQNIYSIVLFKFEYVFIYYVCGNKDLSFIIIIYLSWINRIVPEKQRLLNNTVHYFWQLKCRATTTRDYCNPIGNGAGLLSFDMWRLIWIIYTRSVNCVKSLSLATTDICTHTLTYILYATSIAHWIENTFRRKYLQSIIINTIT